MSRREELCDPDMRAFFRIKGLGMVMSDSHNVTGCNETFLNYKTFLNCTEVLKKGSCDLIECGQILIIGTE